jgi:uncharacterized membrane protein
MKVKLIIVLFLFVLLIYSIRAEVTKTFNITDIEKCVNTFKVKIQHKANDSRGNYTMVGCTYIENDLYMCNCNNPTKVVFGVDNKVKNEFDFIIQYYVAPLLTPGDNATMPNENDIMNDANKRDMEINNIVVKAISEPIVWPKFEGNKIIYGVIALGVLVVITVFILIFIWALKGDKEDDEGFKRKEKMDNSEDTKMLMDILKK